MTDYATMPAGRELDALVAERVMAWTRLVRAISAGGTDGVDGHGRPLALLGRVNGAIAFVPPYSTDIGAAWLVIKRLQELGCNDFSLEWEREKWGEDRPWMYVMNVPRHVSGSKSFGMPDPVALHAATAPLAICLAALRSVP